MPKISLSSIDLDTYDDKDEEVSCPEPWTAETETDFQAQGLHENSNIRAKELESKYLARFREDRFPDETFHNFLQRLIRATLHMQYFEACSNRINARLDRQKLTCEFRRIYGRRAFIRKWTSVRPPPPNAQDK